MLVADHYITLTVEMKQFWLYEYNWMMKLQLYKYSELKTQNKELCPVGNKPPDDICGRSIMDVVWPTENGLTVKVFGTSIQVI